ncbi:hypothetical protein [Streptomyces rimosus]|uniref:fascin domain-containing protein n=1 Tax=Streptomyces rimosus TaxID=1927 RepID=UPI0004C68FD4|nr:hypothetical protein [Streptomyces rimosus]
MGTVKNGRIGVTGKAGAGVCKGDTGSPAFREQNGRYQFAAISSASWQGGCFGTDDVETRNSAVAVRVDDINEWARTTVRRPALKSLANDTYVTAEINDPDGDNGLLRARSDRVGAWERFTVERVDAMRGAAGTGL